MAVPKTLQFGEALIAELPTPMAHALWQLQQEVRGREQSALLTLWRACEAAELIVRLLASVAMAELHRQQRLAPLAHQLATMIDRPTLGQWLQMLSTLIKQLGPDTVLRELKEQSDDQWIKRFFRGDVPGDAPADRSPLNSFLALRNRLAHGAGITHEAARLLLQSWEERIARFLHECLWMRELRLVGTAPDGQWHLLRGLKPQPGPAQSESGAGAGANVWVERAGSTSTLWPLICYGVPQLPESSPREMAVQLYAHRSAIDTLQYTPIDSSVFWSFGGRLAAQQLDEMLTREQLKRKAARESGALESFRDEVFKDGKQMVGRRGDLQLLHQKLKQERGHLLWLDGDPGSGKSTLMAKLVTQLLDQKSPDVTVLPYRFKVGDWRCSAQSFLRLVEQALDPALAANAGQACTVTSTADALRKRVERGGDCILVLDGLDEIDEVDPSFIGDVCLHLAKELGTPERAGAGRITWLCAGRTPLTPRMVDGGAKLCFIGGLPRMEPHDIRAMLLDRIGNARNKLLSEDIVRHELRGEVDWTLERAAQLDAGEVPDAVLALCTLSSGNGAQLSHTVRAPRALPVVPGAKWVIDDDNDNEMYFVDLARGKKRLRVHADRAENDFISQITERSKGLPIYVRCVINDVLAGRFIGFASRELPETLNDFYQQLLKRNGIGDVTRLLTPMLCLIAVARESIDDQQLVTLACREMHYEKAETAAGHVADALVHLSPMLRPGQDRRRQPGYTLYHHSFREYLDPRPDAPAPSPQDARHVRSEDVRISIVTAKHWLCERSREAADAGLETLGPFAHYVARWGIDHLLEFDRLQPRYHGIAHAMRLLARLGAPEALLKYELRPSFLTVLAKRIAEAVNQLVDDMGSGDAQQASLARDRALALPIDGLLHLIRDIYETGTRKGVIRVLAELYPDRWDELRMQLHTPYDMVFRHDAGEVLAELWSDADSDEKAKRLAQLHAMTRHARLEEREVAGYALKEVYQQSPECIDLGVVRGWAAAPINIERMILGELLLGLAGEQPQQALALQAALPAAGYAAFWHPAWEYHRIDLSDYRVQMAGAARWPELAGDTQDAALARCAREAMQLQAQRRALGQHELVRVSPRLRDLLSDERFAALGRDVEPIMQALGEIAALLEGTHRGTGLKILEVLMSHSLWQVSEGVSLLLDRLIERDSTHLSLIDALLADGDAHWRVAYTAVDAAYNAGGRDGYRLFERAVVRHHRHASSRVRGCCADDFLAWLRMGDANTRQHILRSSGLGDVLRHWVKEAADCWLLEYAYLIVRLLHRELQCDVAPFLADGVSTYLQGVTPDDKPFYECERDELLLRIEHRRVLT